MMPSASFTYYYPFQSTLAGGRVSEKFFSPGPQPVRRPSACITALGFMTATKQYSKASFFFGSQWGANCSLLFKVFIVRPVFTHGPPGPGPGPRAANSQGRHIKKIEIEVWYAEKEGCPRERNLREIYTENNVGTEFSRYDATGARRS